MKEKKKEKHTYTFMNKSINKSGKKYIIYIPVELAEYIRKEYGGKVDITLTVPTEFPRDSGDNVDAKDQGNEEQEHGVDD